MADKTIDDWLDETSIDTGDIPDDYGDKYSDPELRWRLKEAIQASPKGGDEGEWSARKAQLLTQEYEKRGGGYKGEKSESQKSLEAWGDEDWQTSSGSADAASGSHMSRYLPRDAWALLPESARREAEKTKEKADKQGEQHAEWPDRVRRTMAELGKAEGDGLTKEELYERAQELDVDGRSGMSKEELKEAILSADRAQDGGGQTKEELYERAQELDIDGRSTMSKDELERAVNEADG